MTSRRIFIVHGHDEAVKEATARFLLQMKFDPIILHEQPSGGQTIIEKIERFKDVNYAIVILSSDDEGGKKGGVVKTRARQNVVFEWGYFIGILGRSHVSALKQDGVDIPSDLDGVVYHLLDAAGAWKNSIAKELQWAGFDIDWSKIA